MSDVFGAVNTCRVLLKLAVVTWGHRCGWASDLRRPAAHDQLSKVLEHQFPCTYSEVAGSLMEGAVQSPPSQPARPFLSPDAPCRDSPVQWSHHEGTWRCPRAGHWAGSLCCGDGCALPGILGRPDEALSLPQPVDVGAGGEVYMDTQ